MPKNYVSNEDESARLFKSNFLEMFSHVHPTIPLVIFVPIIGYFLYRGNTEPLMSPAIVTGLFFAGLFVWSLTEYLLHRFVFHYAPTSVVGKKLHFLLHGVHHDYPNDSLRLVMPPVVSLPLALLFYSLFVFILGEANTWSFFAGFLAGYLCYDMVHYATHHFAMKGAVGLWLKHHHMKHHYQTDHFNYGVSSPVWDFVFGTFLDKKQPAANS